MSWYDDYENIRGHMEWHDVKGWLLAGAKAEKARTIYHAIDRMDARTLKRRLARALARDDA